MSFLDDVLSVPGDILDSAFGKKKSNTVNPNAIPLGGPINDPNKIFKEVFEPNTGQNSTGQALSGRLNLNHGGEVEIGKGKDYIKDLL